MEPTVPPDRTRPAIGPAAATVRSTADALLRKRSPVEMVATLKTLERPTPAKTLGREIKSVVEELAVHIAAGAKREALATALAAMFADADVAIGRMRRGGVLRASKYGFDGVVIAGIARAALAARPSLIARPSRFDYLESLLALTRLSSAAEVLHGRMTRILATREDVALKTVLAVLNSRFFHHAPADNSLGSLKLGRYSIEELSDAASLILSVYRELFPIHDRCCDRIDVEGIAGSAPVYERLFLAAVRLTKFKDAEGMIDGLPFRARVDRGAVRISSIDPDLEPSIRLGYVQHQMQVALRARHLVEAIPAIALRDLIKTGFERGALDGLIELAETPFRRFRLNLPTEPQIFRLFRMDELFRDEIEALLLIDVDAFTGSDPDPRRLVAPHVTVMDLLKVQRYFNFISCMYQRRIAAVQDEADRAYLVFASTILVVRHDRLFEQLQLIFDDEVKSRAVLELLAMDYGANHLDLQYTPLVDLGNHYVVAPHVLAASNLVRNATVAKRWREFALRDGDPMVAALVEALRDAGFMVRSDFETSFARHRVELDLVAWRDGVLFLFECKNAYLPCSVHEMRNSYDHIRKAGDQLDVRRELLGDPANQAALFVGLGWDVPPTGEICTGIVIANRIFNGARIDRHPVRQAHELINVLRTGAIGGDAEFRFWKGDSFTTLDLVDYLGGDSVATKQLEAFEPHSIEYDLGGRSLVFESHVLDQSKQLRIMAESYVQLRPLRAGALPQVGPAPGEMPQGSAAGARKRGARSSRRWRASRVG